MIRDCLNTVVTNFNEKADREMAIANLGRRHRLKIYRKQRELDSASSACIVQYFLSDTPSRKSAVVTLDFVRHAPVCLSVYPTIPLSLPLRLTYFPL